MVIERIVMIVAGTMVLLGLGLGHYVSEAWYLLDLLVGASLIVSGLTGFCPMVLILRKLGFQHGPAFK
ncbi:YgaP family membrane protein [Galenea microaerophila]